MKKAKEIFSAHNVAFFAVFLALVVVFQTCGGFIQIGGLSLSFVLVPIVLGGILLGWVAGGILGFAFGFIVLMYGVAGAEAFTAALLADSPFMTVMICLVKGIAAGIVPALLYKLIARRNTFVAALVAAISAPIMNTGLFIVGCLMINGTIAGFTANGTMNEIVYFLFIGCAGWNFIIEFSINLVLAPAIHRIVLVAEKNFRLKKQKNAASAEGGEGETEPAVDGQPVPETEKLS